MVEAGGGLSHSTLARIEQGRLEPGWQELLHLARVYEVPEDWLLHVLSVEPPVLGPTQDLRALLDRGVEHWRRGEIPEALGCAVAVRETQPRTAEERRLRQRATIEFATYARGMGWLKFARSLLDEVLCEPLEPAFQVRALVLGAAVWSALGSSIVARAFVDYAARLTSAEANPREAAMVLHQKAKVLTELGQFDEAQDAIEEALKLYAKTGEEFNAARATLLLGRILEDRGDAAGGLEARRRALAVSREKGFKNVEMHALLEIGRQLTTLNRAEDAIRALQEALALAVTQQDANVEFHAEQRLSKAYGAIGNAAAAEAALEAARNLAGRIDDGSRHVTELRPAREGKQAEEWQAE